MLQFITMKYSEFQDEDDKIISKDGNYNGYSRLRVHVTYTFKNSETVF